MEISGNATAPTNLDVVLTAKASDGVVEYFADGKWNVGASLTVSENGTYQFRVTDAAGNETLQEVVVDQIDKIAPERPVSVADITGMTSKDVTVSATFAADSVLNEYSLNGGEWQIYENGIVFTANGSVSFRSTDAAGNVSELATYNVTNIDRTIPDAPVVTVDETERLVKEVNITANSAEGVIEYSFDNIEFVVFEGSLTVSTNGSVFFRTVDEVGNVSEVTSVMIENIDPFSDSKYDKETFRVLSASKTVLSEPLPENVMYSPGPPPTLPILPRYFPCRSNNLNAPLLWRIPT